MKTNFSNKCSLVVILLWHSAQVHCLEAPFLDRYEANNFLSRIRRSNTFFEEFSQGNQERECVEESCTREEAREISDDSIIGADLWKKYLRCTRDFTTKTSPQTDVRIRHARDLERNEKNKESLRHCLSDTDRCKPFPCVRSNTVSCQDATYDFECVCKLGYTGRKCESAINECASNPCHGSARCEDEIGEFRCICDSLHEGVLCEIDINDCRNVPSKRCGRHGKCRQPHDSAPYQCICDPGYKGDRCLQDIDECESSPCQHNCTNTEGSFQCSCQSGFIQDLRKRTTCKDVDECAKTNNCQHSCHNTEGGYYCSCKFGYKLDDIFSRYCEDINECAIANGGCPVIESGCGLDRKPCQTCHNTEGQHTCYCPTGFTTYVEGRGCEDIDECEIGDHGCEQACENFPGSYRCLCREGYRLSFNKKTCLDVNECLIDDICEYRCINNPGSYECACRRGYEPAEDRRTCTDKDECAAGGTRCAQICVNTVGSYTCDCRPGFTVERKYRCSEIDECSSSPCGRNGRCHDGENSYSCECRHGYSGLHCEIDENPCLTNPCQNGGTCLRVEIGYSCSCVNEYSGDTCEERVIVCGEGYVLQNDQCVDVDECLEDGLCEQNCENIPGSFFCTCNNGYEAIANKCTDIDECAENPCEQICSNIPGSFFCSCDEGHVLRPDERGCDRTYSCFNGQIGILPESHLLLGTQKNDYVAFNIQPLESIFSLSFEYRTLDPDAVIAAMSDPTSQRYIIVALLKGRLHISAKLDDVHEETTEAPSTEPTLDTKWHQVSMRIRTTRIRISKDGKKLRDLNFSSDDFGSVSTLYYGGLPSDFPFSSDSQQYTNKWLQGCLRKFRYFKLEVTASSNITSNQGCFETIEKGIYFNGTGYLSTDIPGGSVLRLRFNFKSRVPRGTIARVASGGGDEFSLQIEGNQLVAKVRTSEGRLFSSVYTAGNVDALCHGIWHICDVTVASDRIRLHVDGLEAQQQDLGGMRDVELAEDAILYLGGGPDDTTFFAGSMRNFRLNDRPLDLGTPIELNGVFAYSIPLP